jgi:hypothetical protein
VRLLPSFLRRENAALPGGAGDPPKGEAGSDREDWLGDLQGGGPDVNPELSGSAKFVVYDEMRKTDASIKALLLFLKLPVRSAAWGLNPKTEEPEAQVICDFVDWNLGVESGEGQMDLSWDESLQQGMQMLDFGPMFEELVWGDSVSWTDGDGDQHLVRPLVRLAPRMPRTIDKVVIRKGQLLELRQDIPNTQPIPGEKLSYMVFEREGGRWDGVSLLRPTWGPWRLKKALMIAAGIGWDRFAAGLPVVWHPDTPAGEQKARQIGRDVRHHERGYVHFPIPEGLKKEEAQWELEIKNGATTLADPVPLLNWYSGQILEAGLAHFSNLGNSAHGARAVAETQIDPFFLAVQTLANYVRRERSRQVIKRIVEVNFGAEAADRWTPTLTVSKIQARSISTISQAIYDLNQAGLTFTDREAQDDIRELLGLPKLPEDDLLAQGIDPAQLQQLLASAGLDPETLAAILAKLPPEVGVARNKAPGYQGNGAGLEGAGLQGG